MGNLRILRETSLLDVPAVLRNLADAMERGDYGTVHGCAVVWDADAIEVSYSGTGEAAPNAFLLLHAGAAKMMAAVTESKG